MEIDIRNLKSAFETLKSSMEVLEEKGNRKDVSDYPGTRPAAAEAEAVAVSSMATS